MEAAVDAAASTGTGTGTGTGVHIISTCSVRHSPLCNLITEEGHRRRRRRRRCHLTPWDLNLLSIHYIQKGLLFLSNNPSPPPTPTPTPTPPSFHHRVVEQDVKEEEPPIDVVTLLKRSLATTLDHFYPLAGRLATVKHHDGDGDGDTTSIFIDCNNQGAEFVHAAAADMTAADFLTPVFTPRIVRSFFPLNGAVSHDGHSLPLLAVQVTELRDGAVFLGCSMNHSAADGSSFWHFVNTWAEIARSSGGRAAAETPISRLPVHLDRWFPEPHRPPIRLPFSGDFVERPLLFPELEDAVFHFSPQALSALKAKANAEIGTTAAGDRQISSFQALIASVWIAVTRARKLDPGRITNYHIAIGFRRRMQPPLPAGYFGNSMRIASADATAGDLLGRGLGWAAWLLNRSIETQTDAAARNWIESWVEEPSLTYVSGLMAEDLFTGSSPRFDVYGNDFGWGRPVAVRSGIGNKFDGKLTVFPGPTDRSMALEMCLSPQLLGALMADGELMGVATLESSHHR